MARHEDPPPPETQEEDDADEETARIRRALENVKTTLEIVWLVARLLTM